MLKRCLDELFTVTWQKTSEYFHLGFKFFFCCYTINGELKELGHAPPLFYQDKERL